jgi:sterol desaturase/sphingolipid hydroxylase (fatty acid hydroxylase superfamily)
MDYIKLSIPVFFLLIGIELLIDRLKKTNYYRFNDAITNLSCGIGSQLSGIFLKILTVGGYVYIYNNYGIFKEQIPFTWWTTIILFVGVDFFYYWFHRLAHEIAVMWGSHVVHHQSEEYNLTVALRQAWLQGAFSWWFYIPLALIGFDPVMFVSIASFQTLYQFWIHTKFIGRLHPWIEYIFNTPSHHRVHHGVNPKYIDKNHGGTLIIFDRMFGTFQAEEEEVVYGVTKQPMSWNPLWLNFEYWIDLFSQVMHTPKFSDKLKLIFFPPGWKPTDEGKPLYQNFMPESFRKYDTKIPLGLNYYVLFQFILILAGTTLFLYNYKKFSLPFIVFISGMVIYSLVNLGGIFESKKWVIPIEYLRLFLITITIFITLREYDFFWYVFVLQSVVFIISIFWFSKHSYFLAYNDDQIKTAIPNSYQKIKSN